MSVTIANWPRSARAAEASRSGRYQAAGFRAPPTTSGSWWSKKSSAVSRYHQCPPTPSCGSPLRCLAVDPPRGFTVPVGTWVRACWAGSRKSQQLIADGRVDVRVALRWAVDAAARSQVGQRDLASEPARPREDQGGTHVATLEVASEFRVAKPGPRAVRLPENGEPVGDHTLHDARSDEGLHGRRRIDQRPRLNTNLRLGAPEFNRLRSREDHLGVPRLQGQDHHPVRINQAIISRVLNHDLPRFDTECHHRCLPPWHTFRPSMYE